MAIKQYTALIDLTYKAYNLYIGYKEYAQIELNREIIRLNNARR